MTIREYTVYREPEILSLYGSVGWSNYTNRPGILKAALQIRCVCLLPMKEMNWLD